MTRPLTFVAFGRALAFGRLALFLGLAAVTPWAEGTEEYTQSRPGELPSSSELERWFELARGVAAGLRSGNPQFTLEMKPAHPYAKIRHKGVVVGRFRTEADSTNVTGEIF